MVRLKEDASRSRMQPAAPIRDRIVIGSYLLLVALATLSSGEGASSPPLTCVTCTELWLRDLLQNVVLFLPVGWLWRRRGGRLFTGVMLGAALSAGIEGVQWALPGLGRDPILGDWLANTAGAAAGWLALGAWRWWTAGRDLGGRMVLGLVWAGAVVSGHWWLTQPVWPTDALWYAQAAPELGHLGPPPGGVIEATVNGIAVPFVLPALEVLGVASVPGTLVLQAHVPLRGVSAGISPVVSLYDGRQREVALLGLRGGRPLGRYRSRAAAFGLTPGTEIAATTGATDWRGLHQTATAITIPLAQAALLGTPRGVIRILLHLALALAPLGVLLVSEWRDPAPLRSSRTEIGTSHLRSIQGKRQ